MKLKYICSMILRNFLRNFVVKRSTFDNLNKAHHQLEELCRRTLKLESAHFQDLWVLSDAGHKKGFFVEFGGYDGKASSNTFVLEHGFGWSRIIVEPGLGFRNDLISNRGCLLDFRAIWDVTGKK